MIRQWSALLGSVFVLMLVYLVYLEVNPEWKRHQMNYLRERERSLERLYRESLADLESPEVRKQIADLRQQYQERESRLKSQHFLTLQEQHRSKTTDLAKLLDGLQKQRSEYRNLERQYLLAPAGKREAVAVRMRALDRAIGELIQRQTQTQAEVDRLASQIDLWRQPLTELQVRLNDILSRSENRKTHWQRSRDSKIEIQQLILGEMQRVERCTSCHRSVDDPLMRGQTPPLRTHAGFYLQDHPPERFGCVACHQGQPRATTKSGGHGAVAHWPRPLLPLSLVGGMCGRCHDQIELLYEPFFTQGKKLFLESGCLGCHQVSGWAARAKIGPRLWRVGDKVNPDWLTRWLRNPKDYLPRTRMPNFRLNENEIADISAFLLSLKADDGEARAEKEVFLSEEKYESGRDIFRRSRCVSCHALGGVGGSLAPDLEKVASKVLPQWLLGFLQNPGLYQPGTRMPHYRFDTAEIDSLASYLLQEFQDFSRSAEEKTDENDVGADAVSRGRRLVQKLGCYGCHEIPGFESAARIGPELTDYGDKTPQRLDFGLAQDIPERWEEWTFAKLLRPEMFRPGLRMPTYGFSEEEAALLVIFLKSLSGPDEIPPSYRLAETGQTFALEGDFARIAQRYQCLECHRIRGLGGTLAPDLSFEGSRVQQTWLRNFLKSPYPIRTWMEPRMPQFNFTDREVDVIVNYMKTVLVRDDLTDLMPAGSTASSALYEQGHRLYAQNNCASCHQLHFEGGALGPELDKVSERLTAAWLLAWIKDPTRLDPAVREPKFGFSSEEARALASFLLSAGETDHP